MADPSTLARPDAGLRVGPVALPDGRFWRLRTEDSPPWAEGPGGFNGGCPGPSYPEWGGFGATTTLPAIRGCTCTNFLEEQRISVSSDVVPTQTRRPWRPGDGVMRSPHHPMIAAPDDGGVASWARLYRVRLRTARVTAGVGRPAIRGKMAGRRLLPVTWAPFTIASTRECTDEGGVARRVRRGARRGRHPCRAIE